MLCLRHLLLARTGELGHALCDGEETLGLRAGGGEGLPVRGGGGGIRQNDLDVGIRRCRFDGGESLFGEGLEGGRVGLGERDGLGEDVNGGYRARILGGAIFFGYGGENGERAGDGLVGGDFGKSCGRAVCVAEVDPDFEACCTSPADGFLEVGVCTFLVGCTCAVKSPVSNWYLDRVDPVRFQECDVSFLEI